MGLNAWHQLYGQLIEQKTYVTQDGAIRPSTARPGATWWWTHKKARSAYRLLARLAKAGVLFTFLHEKFDGLGISSTTNQIEGGTNSQIKNLLHDHRGMTSEHQRRAVDWWCYSRLKTKSFVT